MERAMTEPESSPAAAETSPANAYPRVDDYLDEPNEVDRWERIGGQRREAFPASLEHGDPHFELDALLKAHLADSYVGSVDLKTRVSEEHEYASDTCLRQAGTDPATGTRYLERLVFEVVHKRSKKDTNDRARGFASRGVRRQIGIFVSEKSVREWLTDLDNWGPPMDPNSSLEDPCLAVPLPLAALFDREKADLAIARALEAKENAAIVEMKERSRAQGQATALLTIMDSRGVVTDEATRQRVLATVDLTKLQRWLRRAASATALYEIFGKDVN